MSSLNGRAESLAGFMSGGVTSALLHPLDLLRTRFQVQDQVALAGRKYRSIVQAVRLIHAEEGFRGFYKGALAGCLGSGASWGFYFYFYERVKARVSSFPSSSWGWLSLTQQPIDTEGHTTGDSNSIGGAYISRPQPPRLTALGHMYAAWEAGTLTCILTNPIWLVKTRLQLQQQAIANAAAAASVTAGGGSGVAQSLDISRPYKGMVDAFRRIGAEEGVLAYYKGLAPALLLVSHGMVQFAVYEDLKRRIHQHEATAAGDGLGGATGTTTAAAAAAAGAASGSAHLPKETLQFLAGAASKIVATSVTYPYQVIKARLQQRQDLPTSSKILLTTVSSVSPPQETYVGLFQTFLRIWGREGILGFYKGFSANLLRVAPQSAITLALYEYFRQAFAQ